MSQREGGTVAMALDTSLDVAFKASLTFDLWPLSPQSMYPALPGLLEGNPFSEGGQLRLPDGLGSILEVLKETLKLSKAFQVHPDISLQLCAYLFFFINASMFNALMERGD